MTKRREPRTRAHRADRCRTCAGQGWQRGAVEGAVTTCPDCGGTGRKESRP